MKTNYTKLLLGLGLLVSIGSQSYAEAKPTPSKVQNHKAISSSFTRKMIYNTKYFELYYDKNSTKAAQAFIANADQIALIEAKILRIDMPKHRIKVFLGDNRDEMNSFSTGNGIHLYTNDINAITANFKTWIPYVFSHELTHELIDFKIRNSGINKYVPLSGGIVERMAIPGWFTEGMAVLVESLISNGGGRSFDPSFTQVAKRDIGEGTFTNVGSDGITYAHKRYEYGNSFIVYYTSTYGMDKLSDALDYYSTHKFGGIARSFAHVVGVSTDDMHKNWINSIKESNKLKEDVVDGKLIFPHTGIDSKIELLGDKLYVRHAVPNHRIKLLSGEEVNKITIDTLDLDKDGKVKDGSIKSLPANTFSIGQTAIKDGYIYYTKLKTSSINGTIDSYAYTFDTKTGKTKLLKDIHRAINFVNIDGKILYTFNDKGSQGLADLNNNLFIPSGKYVFKSLAAGENNQVIFSANKDKDKGNKIYSLDLKTKEIKYLLDGEEAFYSDGNIYYKAYYGEDINNIYKYNIASKNVTKVTNVSYGASNPIVKNGELYYLNLGKIGSSLSSITIKDGVNETESLMTKMKEKKQRQEKNAAIYGQYNGAFKENDTDVVSEETLNTNKEKELPLVPMITKPSYFISTAGLGIDFMSADTKNMFMLMYSPESFYSHTSSAFYGSDKTSPMYFDISKKGKSYDKYDLILGHTFGDVGLSNTSIYYDHSERFRHGSKSDSSGGSKSHISQDALTIETPFYSSTFDKDFYGSVEVEGDFLGANPALSKTTYEFGIDAHRNTDTSLQAKTKIGYVARPHSSNDIMGGTKDYFYLDRSIKDDIPFVRDLPMLTLRGRAYFSPNGNMTIVDDTENALGVAGINVNNHSQVSYATYGFITHSKAAGRLYGDLHYTVPINKSSQFGMLTLQDITAQVRYSYTFFRDSDYNNKDDRIVMKAKADTAMAKIMAKSPAVSSKEIQKLISNHKTKELYQMSNDALAQSLNEQMELLDTERDAELIGLYPKKAQVLQKLQMIHNINPKVPNTIEGYIKSSDFKDEDDATQKMLTDSLHMTQAQYNQAVKNQGTTDPKDPALQKKIKDKKADVDKKGSDSAKYALAGKVRSLYDNQQLIGVEKEDKVVKWRHGVVINPALTINGDLFNDSISTQLEVGEKYFIELTDSNTRKNNQSIYYVGVSLFF